MNTSTAAMPDHYQALNLQAGARPEEIEQSFRELIRKHRDRPGDTDPERIERARRINQAYVVLRDPQRRRAYDDSIGVSPVPAFQAPPADDRVAELHPGRHRWPLVAGLLLFLLAAAAIGSLMWGSEPGPDQLAEGGAAGSGASGSASSPGAPVEASDGVQPFPQVAAPAGLPPGPGSRSQGPVEIGQRTAVGDVRAPNAPDPVAAAPDSSPSPTRVADAGAAGTERAAAAAAAVGGQQSPAPAAVSPPQPDRSRPARWLTGGLLDGDNQGGRFQGVVSVRFRVETSGRVTNCRATSAGDAALKPLTCGLLEERLRFQPALNAAGEPIPVEVTSSYTWGRRQRR